MSLPSGHQDARIKMLSDKPYPKNEEIERNVAGAFLKMEQDDIRKYSILLEREDFTDKFCMRVARAVRELIRKDLDVDIIGMGTIMKNEEVNLLELSEEVVTTAPIETWITMLKQFSSQRKAIATVLDYIESIYESTDPNTSTRQLSDKLNDIVDTSEVLEEVRNMTQGKSVLIEDGISSGFVTHDYNDGGLKKEGLTLILGSTNHGKTTVARQILISASMQGKKSFFFCGENGEHHEKRIFSKICATPGQLQSKENLGGRTIWYPTPEAGQAFIDTHAKNIFLIDDSRVGKQKIFDFVFRNMEDSVKKGVELFVLDSLTILAEGDGNKIFAHQREIVRQLNLFKKKHRVHVVLIVHPKKGKGWETTSGASEVEKLCDTIIRYIRVTDDDHLVETQNYKSREKVMAKVDLPEEDKEKITALIKYEKVRDEGTKFSAFLEWDEVRGIAREVSKLPKAFMYQRADYWVRGVHRYEEDELPDTKGNQSLNGHIKEKGYENI